MRPYKRCRIRRATQEESILALRPNLLTRVWFADRPAIEVALRPATSVPPMTGAAAPPGSSAPPAR